MVDYQNFILDVGKRLWRDYSIDIGIEESVCRGKVGKPFMNAIINFEEVQRFIIIAYISFIENNQEQIYRSIGYSATIGPISFDQIQQLERTKLPNHFIYYGNILKYSLFKNIFSKGYGFIYWREFTCVAEEYGQNRAGLGIVRTFRQNEMEYIKETSNGVKSLLIVDTPYQALLASLIEDGFELRIDKLIFGTYILTKDVE